MRLLSAPLLCLTLAVHAQVQDPEDRLWFQREAFFQTDDSCVTFNAAFDQWEALNALGHYHAQFRFIGWITEATVYIGDETSTGTVFPINGESTEIRWCNEDLWSVQMRLATPDPLAPFVLIRYGNWQELGVVDMVPGGSGIDLGIDPMSFPNPPMLALTDKVELLYTKKE